ncbi:helix-turn-helix domain-containing protein [Pantoea piersonii]|uniref:helix-turn-helix domain-containing protein n=1 Tax=Pantoea piersonii TaxID=2364647 RepID=UPI00289C5998|nr:helix-turn-helix domain-containing protein [Pantoea piersonii]
MEYENYDQFYNYEDLEESDNEVMQDFLGKSSSPDRSLPGWRRNELSFMFINGLLYTLNNQTGELYNYGLEDETIDGVPSYEESYQQLRKADEAPSKSCHRDIANLLGDKPSYAPYNGLARYANELTKRDFKKLVALCGRVDRRNLVFIKRDELCNLLETSPDHLNRVLNDLKGKGYIQVKPVEHDKAALKILINPCFIWKGYVKNRGPSMVAQGFKTIVLGASKKIDITKNYPLADDLKRFEDWKLTEEAKKAPLLGSLDFREESKWLPLERSEAKAIAKRRRAEFLSLLNPAVMSDQEACIKMLGVEGYRKHLRAVQNCKFKVSKN